MKFYPYGDRSNPVILLIPGTCCHWTFFQDVIPLLSRKFYTIAVAFDGFDETEDSIYPTMEKEAVQIETYIRKNFNGHICACYGSSLGGSYAACLVQRQNIHIDHAIIGSSDMDSASRPLAAMESRIITPFLYQTAAEGKVPGFILRKVEQRKKENPEMGEQMERFITLFTESPLKGHLKKESIYNQFYSDLVTPIQHGIDVPGTTIHVFYALGMGKKYEKRYLKYFAHPDIRRQNLNHETFLFCYPQEWTREVEDCCGLK